VHLFETTTNLVELRLRELGFQFNPFEYLEASGDARLGEYLIGHETFASAWAETPTCVFAPAGGGKTAMHVYTTRACWVGVGGLHPFPIPYLLTAYPFEHYPPTLESHLRNLVRSGAIALLIGLAFRPEHLLGLDPPEQQRLATFLAGTLPGPLQRYLAILRQANTPFVLPPLLHRAYVLPNPPTAMILMRLCDVLEAALTDEPVAPPTPDAGFAELVDLLFRVLGFRSILLLVDGADAFPETSDDPVAITEWLMPMFAQAQGWAARKIYLKGFLPLETEPVLNERIPHFAAETARVRLQWTPPMLAELIRKRVYVASGGEFDSLDAISSPDLRDVEAILAASVAPLPRELLILVRRVFQEYVHRTPDVTGYLEPADIDNALAWYRRHPGSSYHHS
jgi:hypothetical protein